MWASLAVGPDRATKTNDILMYTTCMNLENMYVNEAIAEDQLWYNSFYRKRPEQADPQRQEADRRSGEGWQMWVMESDRMWVRGFFWGDEECSQLKLIELDELCLGKDIFKKPQHILSSIWKFDSLMLTKYSIKIRIARFDK